MDFGSIHTVKECAHEKWLIRWGLSEVWFNILIFLSFSLDILILPNISVLSHWLFQCHFWHILELFQRVTNFCTQIFRSGDQSAEIINIPDKKKQRKPSSLSDEIINIPDKWKKRKLSSLQSVDQVENKKSCTVLPTSWGFRSGMWHCVAG